MKKTRFSRFFIVVVAVVLSSCLVKKEFFHPNANVSSSGYFKDSIAVGNWYSYFEDGSLRDKRIFDLKGRAIGKHFYYQPNGSLWETEEYSKGKLHGKRAMYDANGALIEECKYEHGIKKQCDEYHSNGEVKAKGSYAIGLITDPRGFDDRMREYLKIDSGFTKSGVWFYFDSGGRLAQYGEHCPKARIVYGDTILEEPITEDGLTFQEIIIENSIIYQKTGKWVSLDSIGDTVAIKSYNCEAD